MTTSSDDGLQMGSTALPFPGDGFTSIIHHEPYSSIVSGHGSLIGRVVFVSGASSTLGQAAALALARAGVKGLVLTSRQGKLAVLDSIEDAILRTCSTNGHKIKILKLTVDVLCPTSISSAASRVEETFGAVDTLLNIAGIVDLPIPLSASDPKGWWETIETNVKGTWSITRALLPLLKVSKSSSKWIVNYTSSSAFYTSPLCSGYSISKLALLRLTEMLSMELSADFGITVVAIHPGVVHSPLTARSVPSSLQQTIIDSPELSAETIAWLIQERREWLSGRFVSCTWDMIELEEKKEVIEREDLLRMKFSF